MNPFIKFLRAVCYLAIYILAFCIEIWTSYIIFTFFGLFWGIVSFFLPIISQIYAILLGWHSCGQFLNGYSIAVISYAIGAKLLLFLMAKYTIDKDY